MTVKSLINTLTSPETQIIHLWDYKKLNYLFNGYYRDLPDDLKDRKIYKIDNTFPCKHKTMTLILFV